MLTWTHMCTVFVSSCHLYPLRDGRLSSWSCLHERVWPSQCHEAPGLVRCASFESQIDCPPPPSTPHRVGPLRSAAVNPFQISTFKTQSRFIRVMESSKVGLILISGEKSWFSSLAEFGNLLEEFFLTCADESLAVNFIKLKPANET